MTRQNMYGQDLNEQLPKDLSKLSSRIMYIENKSGGLDSAGRIGRVYFSRTKRTLYYRGRSFKSLKGNGFKANYLDIESGDEYWISGPKRNMSDRLYGGNKGVEIDDDVRGDYELYIKGNSAQQGDSAEASTIAVRPSKPFGSPR